jgi:hypothetical protein
MTVIILNKEASVKVAYRLASSSLLFASISLLGGYFGRLDGSHAKGSVVKNCVYACKINRNHLYLIQ